MDMIYDDIKAKAMLLHYGVNFRLNAIAQLNHDYLLKRRVYSNYDDENSDNRIVPPEILLPNTKMCSTVINNKLSPLHVDYHDEAFYLVNDNDRHYNKKISFYHTPHFYGKTIESGDRVEQYITKLFGHTIGVFASTKCFFADSGKVCKFCSIKSNRVRPNDIVPKLCVENLLESIKIALQYDDTINCIFISGGVTSSDFDSNFLYYYDLAEKIRSTVDSIKPSVEVTLNSYPPVSLNLLEVLRGKRIAFMISLEAVDESKRDFYCPGKAGLFNSIGIELLIRRLVNVVGYGRVLCFVIEGLEDSDTIIQAARYYGQLGACIVSHILHVDPGTWIYRRGMVAPSVEEIMQTTIALSKIYHEYGLNSSILYGGRSSLDAEASSFMM